MSRNLSECTMEEIGDSPFNLYIYAVAVLKGPLPRDRHELMERKLREAPDEYVRGYFSFLERKKTLWGRVRSLLGF